MFINFSSKLMGNSYPSRMVHARQFANILILIFLLWGQNLVVGLEGEEKLAIPPQPLRNQALEDLVKKYGPKFNDKSSETGYYLAITLIRTGGDILKDPAERYVAYEQAYNIASRDGDVSLALNIFDQQSQLFDIEDPNNGKIELLKAISKAHKKKYLVQKEVCFALLNLARAHVYLRDFDSALKFTERALVYGNTQKADRILKKIVKDVNKKIKNLIKLDSKKRISKGRFISFIQDDWLEGLELLTKDAHEGLSKIARKDFGGISGVKELLQLGDSWWQLSEESTFHDFEVRGLRRRSITQYEKYLDKSYRKPSSQIIKRITVTYNDKLRSIRSSVVGLFDFDRQPYTLNSAIGKKAKIQGKAVWDSKGAIGGALEFNKRNSYLVDANSNLLPLGNRPRSVSTWFRTSSSHGVYGVQNIMSYGTRNAVRLSMTGGRVRFDLGGRAISSAMNLGDQKWHHVAAVYSGAPKQECALYVDGERITETVLEHDIYTKPGYWFIGGHRGIRSLFVGSLDEVAIFHRVLSSSEIKALYRWGTLKKKLNEVK